MALTEERKALLKADFEAWETGTGRYSGQPPEAFGLQDLLGSSYVAKDPWSDMAINKGLLHSGILGTRLSIWIIAGEPVGSNPWGMSSARYNELIDNVGYPWAWSWTTVDPTIGIQMVDDTWAPRSSIFDDSAASDVQKDIWSQTFHDNAADHRGVVRQSNNTFGFTSNAHIDGFTGDKQHYSSNAGYGVFIQHEYLNIDGNEDPVEEGRADSWWDISENHMATANGDSLISGPLDSTVVSRTASNTSGHEIGSGHLLTFIYSGANNGIGLIDNDTFRTHQFFYTQNSFSINNQNPEAAGLEDLFNENDYYSDALLQDSKNIEGDILYLTWDVAALRANSWNYLNPGQGIGIGDGESDMRWDDENSDPMILEEYQVTGAGAQSNTGWSFTLRGAILWNANTAPGNTNINFPIRINRTAGLPGFHS